MANPEFSIQGHRFLIDYAKSKGAQQERDIASASNISHPMLSRIKRGDRYFSPEAFLSLLQTYTPATWQELEEVGVRWYTANSGGLDRYIDALTPSATRNNEVLNALKAAGYTRREDIASELGVSPTYISMLKSGASTVSLEKRRSVMQRLNEAQDPNK